MLIYLQSPDESGPAFWEARADGHAVTIRTGPVGTAGTESTTTYQSAQAANDTARGLADEQLATGFREVPDRFAVLDVDFTGNFTADRSPNRFAALLAKSQHEIQHLELLGCLGNAVMGNSDGGGNIWHEHVSPVDGDTYLFCVDHETGGIFTEVYPEAVFAVISDGEDLDDEYADDPDRMAEVFAAHAPDLDDARMARVERLVKRTWDRAGWLADATFGRADSDPYLPGTLAEDFNHPHFADAPAFALYWLWRAYLTGDNDVVRRLLPVAAGSRSRLVRDAAAAVVGLLHGGPMVGPVDAVARRAEICALVAAEREAAERDEAERNRPVQEVAEQNGHIRALDHRGAEFTELPPTVAQFRSLTFWDLADNRMTALPEEFAALSNLVELDLSSNPFQEFPTVVTRLPRLTRLRYSYCGTSELPAAIGELTGLVELDLSNNSLGELPAAIGGLRNLRELRLLSCSLNTLPPELGQLTELRHLDLGNNSLDRLPDWFDQLANLETLDLTQMYDLAWPETFSVLGRLPKLRELRLSFSQDVPARLPAIPGLRKLRLSVWSWSALQDLLRVLADQPALSELELAGGQLGSLPTEVAELTGLEVVSIRRPERQAALIGEFTLDVPQTLEVLSHLPRLRRLELELDRGFGDMPAMIANLTGLTELDLRGSSFELGPLPAGLRVLDITGNHGFQDYEPDLSGCPGLTELRMGRTRAQALPSGIGPALRILDAHDNDFADATLDLTGCPHLRELDLGQTRLAALPTGWEALSQLERLNLAGAQFADPNATVAGLGRLPNLTSLGLAGLGLRALPEELAGAARLTELDLSCNPELDWASVVTLARSLPALSTLRIRAGQLRQLPGPLAELTGLRAVDLRGNQMSWDELRRIRRTLPQALISWR